MSFNSCWVWQLVGGKMKPPSVWHATILIIITCLWSGSLSLENMSNLFSYSVCQISWVQGTYNCKKYKNKNTKVSAPPACKTYLTTKNTWKWRQDVVQRCYVIPWRHMTSWCRMIGQYLVSVHSKTPWNQVFWPCDLDLWPMTLTLELIQDIIKVNPCAKFRDHMSSGPVVRVLTNRQTHRQTRPYL